jgi:4a-hydroxytetrahydrobiopterin dehydratase
MQTQRLSSHDIDQGLKALDGWTLDAHKASIRKAWVFDSFRTAMQFFAAVGELAEVMDHHPEFLSSYTKMRIRLTTHDAYGLTHQDFALAKQIDQMTKAEPFCTPQHTRLIEAPDLNS